MSPPIEIPATGLTTSPWPRRNLRAAGVLGGVLVSAGISGFRPRKSAGVMSSAAPYNVFHIASGLIGAKIARSENATAASAFNLAFGLIDLYQAFAGVTGVFPSRLFKLRTGDHVVHVLLGALLVAVGSKGLCAPAASPSSSTP